MSSPPIDHFVFGSLRIELRGRRAPDVVVDLQQHGVRMYNVKVSGGYVYLVVGLREFQVVYRTCRASRVKIRILGREGLPFLLKNAWRRKSMIAGCAIFLVLMFGLSSMIWDVQVAGVKEETATATLQTARELGVSVGTWKSVLHDIEGLQDKMVQKMPNLVWVGIQQHGSRVRIEALEQIPGVNLNSQTPRNVVASKTAVIRKIFANRGEVMVKPGQVVHPGQLLISGVLAGGAKQIPADGKALAEVWYTSNVTLPLSIQRAGLTGESVEHDYFAVGPLSLRIWGFKQPNYQATEERVMESDWHLGSWVLPIQLKKVTVYEASPVAVSASVLQAEHTVLSLAVQDVRTKMHKDGLVLGQTVLHRQVSHGKLYETVLTQTEEDIGVSVPITSPAPSGASNS